MTSLETCIREAVEKGGWEAFGHCSKECVTPASFRIADGTIIFWEGEYTDEGSAEYDLATVLFDPLFWSALGRARGWSTGFVHYGHFKRAETAADRAETDEALHNWHRFIDHLAEGKDAELFFATL